MSIKCYVILIQGKADSCIILAQDTVLFALALCHFDITVPLKCHFSLYHFETVLLYVAMTYRNKKSRNLVYLHEITRQTAGRSPDGLDRREIPLRKEGKTMTEYALAKKLQENGFRLHRKAGGYWIADLAHNFRVCGLEYGDFDTMTLEQVETFVRERCE